MLSIILPAIVGIQPAWSQTVPEVEPGSTEFDSLYVEYESVGLYTHTFSYSSGNIDPFSPACHNISWEARVVGANAQVEPITGSLGRSSNTSPSYRCEGHVTYQAKYAGIDFIEVTLDHVYDTAVVAIAVRQYNSSNPVDLAGPIAEPMMGIFRALCGDKSADACASERASAQVAHLTDNLQWTTDAVESAVTACLDARCRQHAAELVINEFTYLYNDSCWRFGTTCEDAYPVAEVVENIIRCEGCEEWDAAGYAARQIGQAMQDACPDPYGNANCVSLILNAVYSVYQQAYAAVCEVSCEPVPSPSPTDVPEPSPTTCEDCGALIDGVVSALPISPPGNVLVANDNVKQAFRDALGQSAYTAFTRRIVELANKEFDDGMRYAPDIVLLQEVFSGGVPSDEPMATERNAALEAIRSGLSQLTGHSYGVTATSPFIPGSGPKIEGDVAILFNRTSMTLISSGYVDHPVSFSEQCLDLGFQDVDFDGLDDCAAEGNKTKRSGIGHFREKDGGVSIAAASIHFLNQKQMADDAMHDDRVNDWSVAVAAAVKDYDADSYAIGGDFNRTRCADVQTTELSSPLEEPRERVVCIQRRFWNSLAREGFVDEVYAAHARTDDTLSRQYKNGSEYQDRRIDFIFSAGQTAYGAASFDLSCGEPGSCKNKTNPERYSDHRLNWAFIGPEAEVYIPVMP